MTYLKNVLKFIYYGERFMKRILGIIIALYFCMGTVTYASGIEVQPTMSSRTAAQDRVWVGTFQLVWNDFMDKVVFNPVRFREGTPAMVQELNRQEFTVDDISEKSYYKTTGKVTKNTKKNISKAIKKKFKETSDLLDKLDLTPRNDKFIIYAMLKKDFEFINAFERLGKSFFGEEQIAEYFGITLKSNGLLSQGVKVLFYNSPEDFAVVLKTKGQDEVYLYKNDSNKAFNYLYADMNKKSLAYMGNKEFTKFDELKVPNIQFFEEKSFEELSGRRIMGTNLVIDQAMETIKFNMDNKGVKLKSEAAMTIMTTSLEEILEPRFFHYDNTFVVFLKEKGKAKPYFALRVNDITKFQE